MGDGDVDDGDDDGDDGDDDDGDDLHLAEVFPSVRLLHVPDDEVAGVRLPNPLGRGRVKLFSIFHPRCHRLWKRPNNINYETW